MSGLIREREFVFVHLLPLLIEHTKGVLCYSSFLPPLPPSPLELKCGFVFFYDQFIATCMIAKSPYALHGKQSSALSHICSQLSLISLLRFALMRSARVIEMGGRKRNR